MPHSSSIGRRTRAFLVAASLLAAAFVPARLETALSISARDRYQDFGIFHRGARCLFGNNCDPYEVDERSAPNLAPPHAHLLLVPVMWLERSQAYGVWLLISVVVTCAAVWRVMRELSISPSLPAWILIAALALGSGVMMAQVTSGQIYAVLTWPVTAAWSAWRRGALTRAACWLAIGASVKVLLGLPLLWFLVRGRWRPALAMAITTLGIFAAGLALFGPPSYTAWLDMLARSPLAGHFRDGAIMPALTRTFGDSVSFEPLLYAPSIVRPAWAALSGVVVSIAILRPTDPDRTFLALLAAATLAAPIGWIYAAVWFVGPATAVWLTGGMRERWLLAAVAAVLWLPDTTPLLGQPSRWLTPTVGSLFFWVWLAFWVASLRSVRFTRPPTRAGYGASLQPSTR